MELHFCDLCNESVPQVDLDQGRAFRRGDRVVCVTCEEAMSHASEAHEGGERSGASLEEIPVATVHSGAAPSGAAGSPRTPGAAASAGGHGANGAHGMGDGTARRGASAALTLATVALMATVGASAYLFERARGEEKRTGEQIAGLQEDVRQEARLLDARLNHHVDRLEEAISRAADERDERMEERLAETRGDGRSELTALRRELERLGDRIEEIGALAARVERHELDLATLSTTTSELHAELLRVTDRLLETRMAEASTRPSNPKIGPSEERPDWWVVLAELESQNSGTRWQAVQALGNTGDPDTAEHLVPMLKDPDIFVRMATARILGDLAAVVGIPALIDALEDPEASVREAAVVSLRGVTGRDFRFDPMARESEREKRVKAWRDWWKKASKDLLGSKTFERGEG